MSKQDRSRAHRDQLISRFVRAFEEKYDAGFDEHQSVLSDLDPATLLYEAKNEVLDLWAYLETLEMQLQRMELRDKEIKDVRRK